MKCARCGFVGSDEAPSCRKCGKDLTDEHRGLGLPPRVGRPSRATTPILDGPIDPSLIDDAPPSPGKPATSSLLDLDAEGGETLTGNALEMPDEGQDRDDLAEMLAGTAPVEPAEIANARVAGAATSTTVVAPRAPSPRAGAAEEVIDLGEPLDLEDREVTAIADWPQDEWEGLEGAAAPSQDVRSLPKGGFWLRVVASVVDSFFIQIVSSILLLAVLARAGATAVIASHLPAPGADPAAAARVLEEALVPYVTGTLGWTILALVVLASLYRPVCHWRWGKTIGKKILGLRLVTTQGERVGFSRACWRDIAYVISCLPLGLGLLWVAWDPQKQAWHDKLSGTYVLKENT